MATSGLIVVAFLLVLLNGFFVAAEFAIVKLRSTHLETLHAKHGLAGRFLKIIHDNLDAYLSACQLGITLASLGLGWVGEPAFAHFFENILHNIPLAKTFATLLAFFIAFFIISYLHIVIGELAPKSLAIRKVEKIALFTAIPLYYFYWLMFPAIWILNQSANFVLRLIGVDEKNVEHSYSAKELKLILTASHLHEDLGKEDLHILNRVLDFTDLTVGDLMRPIHELKAIEANQALPVIIDFITQHHFSRYPIFETEQRDKIIGLLHIKDLLESLVQQKMINSILQLKRPILEYEVTAPAMAVLNEFRQGPGHFAFIKNEVGKYVGFITLDDVLSEALGSIRDEFITPHKDWLITKEGNYIVYGYTSLYTIERLLKINLPEEESVTVSGLILSTLGHMPVPHERIHFDHFEMEILKVKNHRIEVVKIIPGALRRTHLPPSK